MEEKTLHISGTDRPQTEINNMIAHTWETTYESTCMTPKGTHLDKGSQEQYQLVKFQITAIRLLHSIRPWLVNRKVESASTVLFNMRETEETH